MYLCVSYIGYVFVYALQTVLRGLINGGMHVFGVTGRLHPFNLALARANSKQAAAGKALD
jgi:hypothetical protein